MDMNILTINSGSSSIKFSLHVMGTGEVSAFSGVIAGIGTAAGRLHVSDPGGNVRAGEERQFSDHTEALDALMKLIGTRPEGRALGAIGHRLVHGGSAYVKPHLIDAALLSALDALIPFAPDHLPHEIAAIRAFELAYPEVAQVACFDTAFHRASPEIAQRFALPAALHDAGLRRYGFHGISYEYIASVLPQYDPAAANGKAVVLHLGNGASMCAMEGCRSVTCTLGFSALDGLPMGTRSGALDPGVMLYLMDVKGMDARAIEKLVYTKSGLLGVSGISSDMRTLLASEEQGARLAVDLFVYRIRREMGSLMAAMGGVDAVVFTGGIGENAWQVRERVCRDASWLGLELDEDANSRGGPCISTPGSRVKAWVIQTNEELMIARHTKRVTG